VVVVGAPGGTDAEQADFYLDSFAPEQMLELLERLYPRALRQLKDRERELDEREAKRLEEKGR
jgi:hypothetical protein